MCTNPAQASGLKLLWPPFVDMQGARSHDWWDYLPLIDHVLSRQKLHCNMKQFYVSRHNNHNSTVICKRKDTFICCSPRFDIELMYLVLEKKRKLWALEFMNYKFCVLILMLHEFLLKFEL